MCVCPCFVNVWERPGALFEPLVLATFGRPPLWGKVKNTETGRFKKITSNTSVKALYKSVAIAFGQSVACKMTLRSVNANAEEPPREHVIAG